MPDFTTTVLTVMLAGLAADSRPAGGSGKGSARRTAAVVAMLVGALLLKTSMVLPLAVGRGWRSSPDWYVPAARGHR